MMNAKDARDYCNAHGVPFVESGDALRVMDVTLLPGAMRDSFDERGFLKGEEVESAAEVETDEPKTGLESPPKKAKLARKRGK
jgi:hypothetical protein